MTVGDKIKKIRTFRGMTQKELGLAIGFEEKGADNRIAQYETNYRVPKRELLDKMAEALRVDRQNFYTIAPGSAEDFMRTFFIKAYVDIRLAKQLLLFGYVAVSSFIISEYPSSG